MMSALSGPAFMRAQSIEFDELLLDQQTKDVAALSQIDQSERETSSEDSSLARGSVIQSDRSKSSPKRNKQTSIHKVKEKTESSEEGQFTKR